MEQTWSAAAAATVAAVIVAVVVGISRVLVAVLTGRRLQRGRQVDASTVAVVLLARMRLLLPYRHPGRCLALLHDMHLFDLQHICAHQHTHEAHKHTP
jgi:hypothetical protein